MLNKGLGKRCDFRFEFDQPDQIYVASSPVSGTLYITPQQTMRCNALKLGLRWRTHGQGNRAQGEFHPIDVDFYETELLAQETYEVPFAFEAPFGPITYHGKYLNIDWYLQAIVDAPLAPNFLDPRGETELLLLPTEGLNPHLGPYYKEPNDPNTMLGINWLLLLFGLIFAAVGSFIGFMFLTSAPSSTRFFAIVPFIFVIVGLGLAVGAVRNYFAALRMSDISVDFDKRLVMPNETLNCQLSFTARNSFHLEKVLFTLEAKEQVVRGSGSNKKTFTELVVKDSLQALKAVDVKQGETVTCEASFTLPNDAPYTFIASDNALKWTLTILIDNEGMLDWQQVYQVDVVPWHD